MPRLVKRQKGGAKASPIVGTKKEPKTGEKIPDHVARQNAHRDLVEAQMEGDFASSGSVFSHEASASSSIVMKAPEPIAPEALDFAPPQDIRVVRFPKDQLEPQFVSKQTVDVTADEHHEDANLGHIPDFRQDWGYGDEWCQHRRAYRVYVAPQDIPEPKLHGWYVVFATRDPSYQKSTHRVIAGEGRHIHEDFFIAKIGTYHKNGWTVYVDMPDEFKSAKTKEGRVVYQIILAEGKTSMLGPLLGS